MKLREKAIHKMRERDIINNDIYVLQQTRQALDNEIKAIKKKMEDSYKHWIGQKAQCSNYNDLNLQNKEMICTDVFCNKFLEVVPRFEYNGKSVHVDEYHWQKKTEQ